MNHTLPPDLHLAGNYRFVGSACGIRDNEPGRRDLALIVSDTPASAAGVFTQNRVCAAPVRVCRERLPREDVRGIVICSGNANACTGEQGMDDARRMTQITGEAIGCRAEQVLVCSTGVIGRLLPMNKIESGIRSAAPRLQPSREALQEAAAAILTTDTRIKVSSRKTALSDRDVHIMGFAKGAAMIGPNMATMLAFVLTDASIDAADLLRTARHAADRSFNSISVEGHTSTNDTLLILANGTGPRLHDDSQARIEAAIQSVCSDLAREIASDAEGARHLIEIRVEGVRDEDEARRIAKTVAESALVKTAVYGGDPNWGRIVSAAGYSGVVFEEKDLSLWLGDMLLYRAGSPVQFDASTASAYLKNNREVHVRLKFTLGSAHCTFWTCDLTPEYVHLNADYTT